MNITRQIVLDTETTGLEKGHRIIEIGCRVLENRKITDKVFHTYINPQREIEEGALRIHGISQEFLADKPLFEMIADEFLEFIQGAELIIHNAPFDIGFLEYELQLLNKNYLPINEYCTVLCTLQLARKKHPGLPNNLDALCKRYRVDHSKRKSHGALLDADLLAEVYLAMTGGQTQLFADLEINGTSRTNERKNLTGEKTICVSLPVILASIQELEEHKKICELLEQNGHCLWME